MLTRAVEESKEERAGGLEGGRTAAGKRSSAAEDEAALPTIDAVAGQVMKNVNIYAGASDPIAQPDEAYPFWLRLEIERPRKLGGDRYAADGALPTRTEVRHANKARIKGNNEQSKYS